MTKPKSMVLTVFSEFRASHSLSGFETPHFHLWKLSLEFRGSLPLKTDRLIDLVELQTAVAKIIAPLEGQYLNTALPDLSPTSENIAQWLWSEFSKQNADAPLSAVSITLCNLAGEATGTARLEA